MKTIPGDNKTVPGVKIGHAHNLDGLTGCTVIICENGAVGGVDQRGGAPGTRETDALRPMHLVNKAHAIILGGGSAFGLDAATGVMQYLEEKGIGYDVGVAKVPIVSGAILFDLAIGRADIRPDADMGYQACVNATETPPAQGNFGAGTGASAGKILGPHQAMKSGIGSSIVEIGKGLFVSAVMAVNPFGDIIDPKTQSIIAGTRTIHKGPIKIGRSDYFADTLHLMTTFAGNKILAFSSGQNTIIGVITTNAKLTKEEANKVAQMAHNGIAMTIKPAHTMLDGDTIFVMATDKKKADVNVVGAYAAECVASAIVNAVQHAQPVGGLPAAFKSEGNT